MTKNGKQATFEDAVVGEPIRFHSRQTEQGKEAAAWILFGTPPKVSPGKPAS